MACHKGRMDQLRLTITFTLLYRYHLFKLAYGMFSDYEQPSPGAGEDQSGRRMCAAWCNLKHYGVNRG